MVIELNVTLKRHVFIICRLNVICNDFFSKSCYIKSKNMKRRVQLNERNLSQRQLAIKMNVRAGTINHLCKDSVDRVYISTLEQICEALNITIDQLIVSTED
jgi:putative transcriptional regulator